MSPWKNILPFTFQIPKKNKAFIAPLIGIPGTIIEDGSYLTKKKKFVNLKEGVAIAGVSYFTFRKWEIEMKKIPYERPSGAKQGGILLLVENIEAFWEGRGKKVSSRGGKVKILG